MRKSPDTNIAKKKLRIERHLNTRKRGKLVHKTSDNQAIKILDKL